MNCNCDKKEQISIFKGDDTGAFGNTFLRINRPKIIKPDGTIEELEMIYKAELRCGNLPVITFENIVEEVPQPLEFPIDVNFENAKTNIMQYQNQCNLKCYDKDGLGRTCDKGTIGFTAKDRVV